jgi:hypothetical protein
MDRRLVLFLIRTLPEWFTFDLPIDVFARVRILGGGSGELGSGSLVLSRLLAIMFCHPMILLAARFLRRHAGGFFLLHSHRRSRIVDAANGV